MKYVDFGKIEEYLIKYLLAKNLWHFKNFLKVFFSRKDTCKLYWLLQGLLSSTCDVKYKKFNIVKHIFFKTSIFVLIFWSKNKLTFSLLHITEKKKLTHYIYTKTTEKQQKCFFPYKTWYSLTNQHPFHSDPCKL